MKHAIILFMALLITISAASAYVFYDDFNRQEDYTNYSNGWIGYYHPSYGWATSGLMDGNYFLGIPPTTIGGQIYQNFSSTIGFDFSQGARIQYYELLGSVDLSASHCIQFRNDDLSSGIFMCGDLTGSPNNATLYMECWGDCVCTTTTVNTPRSKQFDLPPYIIITYDGTGLFNITRDDAHFLQNNMSGCNLNDMNLVIDSRDREAFFDSFSLDTYNGTNNTNEDSCPALEIGEDIGCIMYDTFPYTDSIYNHKWKDLTGNPLPDLAYIAGGYSLRFNNFDGMFLNNIDIYKNFTNPATFQNISFHGVFSAIKNTTFITQNHSLYLRLKSGNQTTTKLKFVVNDNTEILDTYYYFDENVSTLIKSENVSLLPLKDFTVDFVIHTDSGFVDIDSYILVPFNNAIPDRIEFSSDELDSTVMSYYAHLLQITGSNPTPQCEDGIDNDGDGFIDYPADPACSSEDDDSESPQNFYQCNNGIDDDGDTLIDYPEDPSCTSPYITTELPKQSTSEPNDACPIASMCLLKDTFPYTDDLVLHNWTYDSVAGFTTYNCSSVNNLPDCGFAPSLTGIGVGDYALNLARSNRDFSVYHKNFTNPNLYTNNIADFRIVLNGVGTHPESVNLSLGSNNTNSLRIYLNIDRQNTYTIGGNQFNHRIGIYASSAGIYYFAGYAYTKNLQEFKLRLTLDNNLHTYIIQYNDGTVSNFTLINTTFNYDNLVVPSKLEMSSNAQGNEIFLISANVYGAIIQAVTTCNTITKPKYLYETFDYGLLSDCKWVTNKPISVFGEFNIDNGDGEISAYKYLQYNGHSIILTSAMSRYVTAQWDEYIDSESDDISNTNTIFILDSLGNTVSTIFFNKQGGVYLSENGNPTNVSSGLTTDTSHTIKLVIDLTADKQTLIIDGIPVAINVPLLISGFNYDDIASFQISSVGSQYKIDNVMVYTSDSAGTEIIVIPTPQTNAGKNGTYWGGLFFTDAPTCLSDSDCDSGKCMSYGTCSTFNFKVCDEAGKARDNFCILSEMTFAAFSWAGDVIMENFFFFIVFLILMMILVYLTIMFRSKRG
jgi:hypothetical protein